MRWLIERIVLRSRSLCWMMPARPAPRSPGGTGWCSRRDADSRAPRPRRRKSPNSRRTRHGSLLRFRRGVNQRETDCPAPMSSASWIVLPISAPRRPAPQPFPGGIEVDDAASRYRRDDAVGNARQDGSRAVSGRGESRRGLARECCHRPSAHCADRSSVHSDLANDYARSCPDRRIAASAAASSASPTPESSGSHSGGSGGLALQRALLQQRDEARFRHRPRQEEALSDIAAHPMNGLQIGGILQSFGDRDAPKLCARSMIVWQMPALRSSVPLPLTKLRSSLSSANGTSRSRANDEKPSPKSSIANDMP